MTAPTSPSTASPTVGRAAPSVSQRHPILRARTLAIASIAVILPVLLLSGESSRVATELEYSGVPQDYVVPPGICRLRVEVVGAAGGPGGTAGTPGAGARAIANVGVIPGEILSIRVGGWGGEAVGQTPGAGGWNGGGDGGNAFGGRVGHPGKAGSGGGGATDVRRSATLEHRIVVAAGGAGGAGGGIGGPIGTGGGDGGAASGLDGFAPLGTVNPATGGGGGTPTTGGSPGRNAPSLAVAATIGVLGTGGDGASGGASGGGGGGGGLYGGGGGGASSSFIGGHGGGGSSFGPPGTEFRTGVSAGNGQATISYEPEEDACAVLRTRAVR